MHSTTKVVYSPKIQNPGKMNQKQLDAIAELKKYFPGLSNDLIINGNLNLADRYITTLPDNLTINGSLDLRNACYLEQLPENLVIKGNLYVDYGIEHNFPTSMQVLGQMAEIDASELPDNFTVGGDLVVSEHSGCLPDNLTVGGSLDLRDTKVKELPKGLKVHGNLYIDKLPITSLPADLYVGGNLECYKTLLKNIPETVFIGGGLNISQTGVRIFPKQLKEVNGSLSIDSCPIKYLPNDLIIHGSLNAEGCAMVELPKNLHVDDYLHISKTNIEELPEGLVVGGGIDLADCPIERLPAGLKIKGNLDISGTLIKELPEDLVVNDWLYINDSLIEKLPAFVNAGRLEVGAGRVRVDIFPEEFSITGDLRLCVYSDGNPEPLILPANMKISGDLNMSGSRQKQWPKNLYVGGDVSFGDSDMNTLPTDATIKGRLILYSELVYGYTIILGLISGELRVPYPVVVSRNELRTSMPIFSSYKSGLEERLIDYAPDESKVEILPLPVDNTSTVETNESSRKKKKELAQA